MSELTDEELNDLLNALERTGMGQIAGMLKATIDALTERLARAEAERDAITEVNVRLAREVMAAESRRDDELVLAYLNRVMGKYGQNSQIAEAVGIAPGAARRSMQRLFPAPESEGSK